MESLQIWTVFMFASQVLEKKEFLRVIHPHVSSYSDLPQSWVCHYIAAKVSIKGFYSREE